MPQITVEYTNNITNFEPAELLKALNQLLYKSQLFHDMDIKSRAVKLDDYLVGLDEGPNGFVYVKVAILSGRTEMTKCKLAEQVLVFLKSHSDWNEEVNVQICVEVLEMERASYQKILREGKLLRDVRDASIAHKPARN